MRRATRHSPPPVPRFVIITGLSGSGKTQVHKCFEDLGYFCIDNLPLRLVPEWGRLWKGLRETKTALIIDVRERSFLEDFGSVYARLKRMGLYPYLVFLEADDTILLRRFSETRRPHPLARRGETLARSIARERTMLNRIRALADDVINTSRQTVHQLRRQVLERYGERLTFMVSLYSFGFRFGIPPESDLVIDVRMLPNPFFIPRLKGRTGLDPSVVRFMRSHKETDALLEKTLDYLRFLVPRYREEGKSYLTISFGCTGGKHRSVFVAEQVRRALERDGLEASVTHRDLHAD